MPFTNIYEFSTICWAVRNTPLTSFDRMSVGRVRFSPLDEAHLVVE